MTINMVGRLSQCLLLAYRTPASSVRALAPRGLELVTHGPWAFWNVVVCRVSKMRPAGWPTWCGVSYHHVAYRLYVRGRAADGQVLDGLYFVRSDADCRLISLLGNAASDFRFHRTRACVSDGGDALDVGVSGTVGGAGDAALRVRPLGRGQWPTLAADSCFASYAEARRLLKYRPLGLSISGDGRWLKLAEVFRDDDKWREAPVHVADARWGFFDAIGQRDAQLETATRVTPIDYHWRLGRKVRAAAVTDGQIKRTSAHKALPYGSRLNT